jgi:hypothetical protein
MTLVISRDNVFEESFNQFKTTPHLDIKKGVQIHFIDEVAQDVGGVFREWYSSLFNEVFHSKYNLFIEIQNSYGPTSMFFPLTKPNNLTSDPSEYYEFIGKIVAKGIYDKTLLKVKFNRLLLLFMLSKKPTLEDLKYFDYQVTISQ